MRTWRSFFNGVTGEISPITVCVPDHALALNTPKDHVAIDGRPDRLSQRVEIDERDETGKPTKISVVDYQPPQPDEDHEWRESVVNGRPRWVKKAEVVERENKDRAARAALEELDAKTVRTMRELLADKPEIAAIEAEAAELRKDVIRTEAEKELAESFVAVVRNP